MSRMEGRDCCRAALLTSISKPPSPLTASATSFLQKASSRRSPGIAIALRPAALISAITSLTSASSAANN